MTRALSMEIPGKERAKASNKVTYCCDRHKPDFDSAGRVKNQLGDHIEAGPVRVNGKSRIERTNIGRKISRDRISLAPIRS